MKASKINGMFMALRGVQSLQRVANEFVNWKTAKRRERELFKSFDISLCKRTSICKPHQHIQN